MYIYEAEGKNRAEAEENALNALNVSAEEVRLETAPQEKGGLFGFVTKKPSAVRVFPIEGKTSAEKIIEGVTLSIIEKMGLKASISNISFQDENLYVEINSPDSAILIGKHGRTLDALQFLVTLIVKSKWRDGKRILLDVEQYREKRKQSLIKLSKNVASRVQRTQNSVLLDFMNPYERRIIHLSLENDDRVSTRSDGSGLYKRVRVFPVKKGHDEMHDQEMYDEDSDVDDLDYPEPGNE